MSTDPFSGVGVLTNEISQPVYAELIYTKTRIGRAFAPRTATVENSLRRLAFGKPGPIPIINPQPGLELVASPPDGEEEEAIATPAASYNFAQASDADSVSASSLRLQRVSNSLSDIVRNSIQSLSEADFQAAISPQDVTASDCPANHESVFVDTEVTTVTGTTTIASLSGLTPGSLFYCRFTVNFIDSPFADVALQYYAGSITDLQLVQNSQNSFVTDGDCVAAKTTTSNGIWNGTGNWYTALGNKGTSQTFTVTGEVLASGTITVMVAFIGCGPAGSIRPSGTNSGTVEIDDVLVCVAEEEIVPVLDCTTAITGIRTLIQWNGSPRAPVNIFNMFARATFRNPVTLATTTTDLIPLTDGRLGTVTPTSCGTGDTCDFWKQEGVAGVAQTEITNTGLTPAIIASVTNGQSRDVSDRVNWLWSVPSGTTGQSQDALATLWPDAPSGLLQSIEVFMLTHQVVAESPQTRCVELNFAEVLDYGVGYPAFTYDGTTYYESANTAGPIGSTVKIGGGLFTYDDDTSIVPAFTNVTVAFDYASGVAAPSLNNIADAKFVIFKGSVSSGNVVATLDFTPIQDGFVHSFSQSIPCLIPAPTVAGDLIVAVTVVARLVDGGATPVFNLTQPRLTVCGTDAAYASTEADIECPDVICSPDPGTEIDLVLRYTNPLGQNREFSSGFNTSALLQVSEPYPPVPNNWDAITALGNGILSPTARWESALFILDTIDGSGLDQCSEPAAFNTFGQGILNFGPFVINGNGQSARDCVATIEITEIKEGRSVDEEQSIILPAPSGGIWTLTFNDGTLQEAITLAANVTAAEMQEQLEGMAIIGADNVLVTGSGTSGDPFIVKFVRLLGSVNLKLMAANGINLVGCASGLVSKLRTGTLNERQTITKQETINDNLLIRFNGVESSPIPFNSSLNQMQSFLEGISTIGVGNVSVTGNLTDRNAAYQGPWFVDFVNGLAAQNVPKLTPQTTGYTTATTWQGGIGTNEIQKISITADVGSWTLTLAKPDGSSSVTTAPLSVGITAAALKTAILTAASWLTSSDIVVKALPATGNTLLHEWTVEFAGTYAGEAFDLMTVDTSGLTGCHITVTEKTKGGGAREQQKILIKKAQSGTYKLSVVVGSHEATETTAIAFDASAEEVEFALSQTEFLAVEGDVMVQDTITAGPNVTASFIVSFDRRFGAIPVMTATNNLFCSPLNLPFIPPPPYEYPLPDCGLPQDGCSPGPVLCRPGPGDPEIPDELCCEPITIRDSANYYREVILQRELFDPYKVSTIRDMASAKGLRSSAYNAYAHNFRTGQLLPISMVSAVANQTSTVLIETEVDTPATRDRISRQLMNRQKILPARMIW